MITYNNGLLESPAPVYAGLTGLMNAVLCWFSMATDPIAERNKSNSARAESLRFAARQARVLADEAERLAAELERQG